MSVVLNDEEVRLYFSEIATGTRTITVKNSKGKELLGILRQPTALEYRVGAEIYKDTFEDSIVNNIRTRKQLETDFIKQYNFLTEAELSKLSRLESELKVLRKQLIRLSGEPILVRQRREDLDKKEIEYYTLFSKRAKYYTETAEYQAESTEMFHYAKFCISLWKTTESFLVERDDVLRRQAIQQLTSFVRGFDQGTLRALARNPIIRTRWRASKKTGNPFFGIPMQGGNQFLGSPSAYWTPDQIGMSSWLMYYDDVTEAFEAPEWLLKDDEKLDRWVEKKMEAKERERIKKLGVGSDRDAYDHEEVIVFGDDKDLLFGEGSPYTPKWDKGKSGDNISDQKSILGNN